MMDLTKCNRDTLKTLKVNAERTLKHGRDDQRRDAQEMLNQIALEIGRRLSKRTADTGEIEWTSETPGYWVGLLNGVKRIEIHKDANHNSDNNEVYTVYIDGTRWSKRFRYIEQARIESAAKVIDTSDAVEQ